MREVADWLKARGAKFSENRAVRTSEQIPLSVLPRLLAMKDGGLDVLDSGGGRLDVVRVIARKSAPIDEATAAPRIRQFLANRRSSELISEEMKRLRKLAKIEYVGEFAGGAAAVESGGVANVEVPNAGQAIEPNIEKGVRGLQ